MNLTGGEPTLHAQTIIDAMTYLRQHGFRGLFTIFSNGVQAQPVSPWQRRPPRQRGRPLAIPAAPASIEALPVDELAALIHDIRASATYAASYGVRFWRSSQQRVSRW